MQTPSRPPSTIEEKVGAQVSALRQMRDLTQRQLAALVTEHGLPVDASAISRIEKGQRALRLSEALVLAEAFGVDLSLLVMGLDTPEQAFRSARRYANQLMNEMVDPTSAWLNALAHVSELARESPSHLAGLKSTDGRPGPRRPEDYLPWVLDNLRSLNWDIEDEAYVDEEDEDRREELRAIGYAFIDSILRAPAEIFVDDHPGFDLAADAAREPLGEESQAPESDG